MRATLGRRQFDTLDVGNVWDGWNILRLMKYDDQYSA